MTIRGTRDEQPAPESPARAALPVPHGGHTGLPCSDRVTGAGGGPDFHIVMVIADESCFIIPVPLMA
jgi:hypothetical protein